VLYYIVHDRAIPGTDILLSQGLLALIVVGFLTVDFLRLRLHRFKDVFIVLFGSLLRRREFTGLTGGSYLLLATLVCAFIYQPRVLIPATTFLALGDTVAAIVGLSVGRVRFWRKTLEGTLAGFAVCLGVAYVASILPYWNIPLGVGILGAVTASLVEALPIEVNDNVAVPIMSGLVMQVALWLKVFGA
jgi:glycerol-3-phosphate acyltransferase PlsY